MIYSRHVSNFIHETQKVAARDDIMRAFLSISRQFRLLNSRCLDSVSPGGRPTNYCRWYLHVCVSAGGLPTNYVQPPTVDDIYTCVCLLVDFQPTTVDGISTCVCLLVDFQPTTVDDISTCVCLLVDFQPTTVDGISTCV